ncbi:MAG: hypothetical protein IPF53_00560 [Blastocatellia bacterium]|nr:hypothetical protein [Blastocatellia bacterium]
MTSKIKDLVELNPSGQRSASGRSAAPPELETFLLSYEMGDVIVRTVERLSSTEPGPHNCLIVGGPGCGKSRLLAAVASLFEVDPEASLHPRLAEVRALAQPSRTIVVRVEPEPGERRLLPTIERAVLSELEAAGFAVASISAEAVDSLLAFTKSVATLPTGHRLIITVDNVDTWLAPANRFAEENAQTLVRFGDLGRDLPVALCAAAGEYVITHDSSAGSQGWIAALLDTYRIEYVSARALRSATASNILVKNARQRREISNVLEQLRKRLPDLPCTDEEFVELYPLEVSTWGVGGQLHRWIDGFSFPEFAARAAESVKRRPAASLFALNDMFTLYEPQLRQVDALEPIFDAYDRLVLDAVPRLGQNQRLWGRLALQSIFMHTIAGISADVKTITNSVLLYDLHGGVSSYAMMSAVLKQMETLDAGQIVATGEGTSRRYGLVTDEREGLLVRIEELADTVDEDSETLSALLGVGGHVFADWPFGASPAGPGRTDLWNIDISGGLVTLHARTLDGRNDEAAERRPRLVLFPPGRPWSEATDVVRADDLASCWIVSKPTAAERAAVRRWMAAARLSADEGGRRHPDLPSVLAELETAAVAAFLRVYVEGGTLVTSDGREAIAEFASPTRAENLVVRMLPPSPSEVSSAAEEGQAIEPEPASEGASWLACLLSANREEAAGLVRTFTAADWLSRLESWYGMHVGRDDTGPIRLLGQRGEQIPEVVAALDAKQLFDVLLYYTRRALSSRTVGELCGEMARAFETENRVWEARERLSWLARFAEWLPILDDAARYLGDAETTEDEDLEALRTSLVEWMDRLGEFVNERRRSAFSDSFAAYRDEYSRIYTAVHDRAVGGENVGRLSAGIVESQAWQALENLSSLTIGNPSYLVDAINLISVLRETQCSSNVDSSLKTHPLCACGFRFGDQDRIASMASSATDFVQMGIEHHMRLLQARKAELKEKLIAYKSSFDLDTIRSIAELTKESTPPRVEPATIDAINTLLDPEAEWQSRSTGDNQALQYRPDRIM